MKWISVNDQLPKDKKLVVVAMPWSNPPTWNLHLGYFVPSDGWHLPHYDGKNDILWWAELTNPPELSTSDLSNMAQPLEDQDSEILGSADRLVDLVD